MDQRREASTLSSAALPAESRLMLPASCDPPSPQNPPQQRVWVVFGASGHIGRSVVKAALSHNDCVTAVGRVFQDSIQSMKDLWPNTIPLTRVDPESNQQPSYLPLVCDVRIRDTVESVFQRSQEHWGQIDIIVNCSGYGIIAACEDQDDFEIRDQFEANFWGTLNILQLSLPLFRQQEYGRYIVFSSTSGALGVPGLGPYCATKYAVEGLIESMLYETATFNIRATLIEPGHVRRDDPPTNLRDRNKGSNTLRPFGHFFIKPASAPYDNPTSPSGHARRTIQWLGEKQPTSAVKAAELVWQLGHCQYPPLRLLLGGFAVESVRDRLRSITEEIEDWKFLSFKHDDDGREDDEKTSAAHNGKDEVEEDIEDEDEEEEEADYSGDVKIKQGNEDG